MRKLLTVGMMLTLLLLPTLAQDSTTLTVLHTSNVVGAHEAGGDDAGGTARVATLVESIRSEVGNLLILDAGDRSINPALIDANIDMMNQIGYDAMTLGNHEFNGGNEGVATLIEQLNFPIVAANVDFSQSSILAGTIEPFSVVEINGEQYGIVGIANETAPILSSPGADLIFLDDEISVTQDAVNELQSMGVNKIILIAHQEVNENLVLASAVDGVDIIVGGSDTTFLSSSDDDADEPYPIETTSRSGEPVLIVQTTEGNRYLGRLDVTFDADGLLTEWTGDTLFLSSDITPNAEVQAIVDNIAETQAASAQVIGATEVTLVGGDPCREEECTMGNLITDALREQANVDIAVYNSGGIRATIPAGDITDAQVLDVLPFGNSVARLELVGVDIIAMLEHSVSLGGDAEVRGSGRFLQVSGMHFSWDATRPEGSRIIEVDILNDEGDYEPLDRDAIYSVATNDFIRNGGDEYSVLAENAIDPFDFGPAADQVVIGFIRANTPVSPTIEGRITRLGD